MGTHCRVVARLALLLAAFALPAPALAQPPLLYMTSRTTLSSDPVPRATLHVLNPATARVIATVDLGPIPSTADPHVIVSPDGATVYATAGGDLVAINPLTMAVNWRQTLGPGLGALALSSDGTTLYVAQSGTSSVLVLATPSLAPAGDPIPLPAAASRLALAPDGSRLYALATAQASVYVADTATREVTATMTTAVAPVEIIAHPDAARLFVLHSTGTDLTGDGDSLAQYDAATLSHTGTLVLPDFRVQIFVWYPSTAGQMALDATGGRIWLPRVTQGWRSSPTAYLRREVVHEIDIAGGTMTLGDSLVPPETFSTAGAFGVAVSPAGHVVASGAGGTHQIDPVTLDMTGAGTAIPGAIRVAAGVAPPCWFEVSPPHVYARSGGGQVTVPIPAPAGCSWTAPWSGAWIAVLNASGTGPGNITIQISASPQPRTGAVHINGQMILVSQLIGSLVVETPASGSEVTLPFDLAGWAADRRAAGPFSDSVTDPGIDLVELWVQTGGGTPTLLRSLPYGLPRSDVGALFGAVYTNSGFAARIGRLAAGAQTFIVRARSRYDGLVHEVSVPITVRRQPLVAIDAPGAGAVLRSPFEVSGWAADMTAPAGTGIDAVHVWAYPSGGGLPIFAGAASYGHDRGDLQTFFGFGPIRAGYRLTVGGLPDGTYTLVVFAHSIQTNAFDATASVVVTVAGPPPGAPFGFVDTPTANATVAGAIGITGWALDETGVTRVAISRAPMGSETGEIYIGDATFVTGVRPDVMAAYPGYPNNASGWGLMVLTNMLPGGGNGPVTFHADAYDGAGNITRLGSQTVTAENADSLLPFGTLDTPGEGATVSGTIPVFGWALSPSLIPVDGSTIDVLIDNVAVGHPTFNLCRGSVGSSPPAGTCNDDIATTFGAAYPNIALGSGAIGVYMLDTTTLTPGIHTIAWRVTDGNGRTAGIGSRFIWVNNP